ncbi:MAG TPA: type I polyketide synthase, partial [Blastocatellia bacterium]
MNNLEFEDSLEGVAIIGLAGRFPGARNVEQYWQNLKDGVESISFFSDEELEIRLRPNDRGAANFVKARGVLEGADLFDASFFGFNPKEAEITNPQHRVFLECAWEALENAGYVPETYPGLIGVYAGASLSNYASRISLSRDMKETVNSFQLAIGNDKDYLCTRVSYKLNLRGPSLNVQTGCSTSLVAAHLACQSLLSYQCDMALAGGVSIRTPQKTAYLYIEGGINSPDGHCRPFDARAQGTVSGNGVGIVVLKRLADAIADRDNVLAVIKGSAINNDGSSKVGFTAPSVKGQAAVITMAQMVAGVQADTISYIEAHGTGTPLGDPIELAALTEAFRVSTQKKGFCGVGSAKSNIGHLDAAAGVAGLIKTVFALKHKRIPPSLHFASPNPQIDFEDSPFYIADRLAEWKSGPTPRRAGVSSFGIGGTNAHLIVEEAPPMDPPKSARPCQLIILSAKTDNALELMTTNIADHLKQFPDAQLGDVAFTLQVGRSHFNKRRMIVCSDLGEAVSRLEGLDPEHVFTSSRNLENRPVIFMFPGQGSQSVNMGLKTYEHEQVFREAIDESSELLEPHLGLDIRQVLFPPQGREEEADNLLEQTFITQPALFVIEYALATLWMTWGVRPKAMIGHSIGEYVAATLAGVFSLRDALGLVAERGRLMQSLPTGAMLAVPLPVDEVSPLLTDELSLAVLNA